MKVATVAQALIMKSLMFVLIGVCPPLQNPKNGRVLIQGNIAAFVCFPGATATGNPFLTCINGNWNSPPPTCKLLNP